MIDTVRMGKIIIKILKILFVLIMVAAVVVGLYLLVRYKQWPWWVGVAIGVGLFGLVLAALFFQKWFFRRREKKFVERIVQHDESVIGKTPVGERQELQDLQTHWKEAVENLQQSHLRRRGNPLYVLPWYLVLGESGSGKTTAIQSARMHSPMTDVHPTAGISGTRNCDWWFFDQAIILDTAGRYTIPVDEEPDKEEWQKFLGLLAKYRRKEPLNGVVATIAADKLMSAGEDALAEDARNIRRRIDELMRVLGAKIPVWVLVTKVDKVLGLTSWADVLPPGALDQAMGDINISLRETPGEMIETGLSDISDRLKDLRLLLLHRYGFTDPALLLFPDELNKLKPGLKRFIETAFETNIYLETPLLRGIYFSSGRQEGAAYSQLIGSLEAFKDYEYQLPGTSAGYFLKDFFTRILPGDRNLFSPLREYLNWRRVTQSLGLSAWLGVFLCACGVLTLSFVKNMEAVTAFTEDFPKPPALTGDLGKDLVAITEVREQLIEMSALNRDWWIPRMGLHQSLITESKLKEMFCQWGRQRFLDPLDTALAEKIRGFDRRTPTVVVGAYVEHLSTRINLINAVLKGRSHKDLLKMPSAGYMAIVKMDQALIPEVAARFGPLYLSYLEWNPDHRSLNEELANLQDNLAHVMTAGGTSMKWLVDWANEEPDLNPVTLGKFWGIGQVDRTDEVAVRPAYTLKGRQRIDDFVKEVNAALVETRGRDVRQNKFNAWYWKEYVKAWQYFGRNFDNGYIHLKNSGDRRELAQFMADQNNPYFQLLDRMSKELEPAVKMDPPQWVRNVVDFQTVKRQADQKGLQKAAGAISKAAEEGRKVVGKVVSIPDDKALKRMENLSRAAERYKDYEEALTAIIPMTSSREMSFKMAGQFFPYGTDSDDKQSPFHDASTALTQLRTAMNVRADQNDVYWRLLSGPLSYLLAYLTKEAACELQLQWEGDVLASTRDMPDEKLADALFAEPDGLVWKFVKGSAAPFLSRGAKGFYARKCLNQEFPFTQSFLSFLDRGAANQQLRLPEYEVVIRVRPTDVNKDARLEPYAAILTMDCAKGPQRIQNFNYPATEIFKWTPDQCGLVTLKILFDNFTLVKHYEGVYGLPWFLHDFRDGTRTFTREDFPDHAADLEALGITEIRVGYLITGGDPVRKLLETKQLLVPGAIVECWDS